MSIIQIKNLSKRYPKANDPSEEFYAVDDLSLIIAEGEIFGLLGPNGAGKTTSLEMIEGITDIDDGYVDVCGYSTQNQVVKVKEVIGVQLQENEYFDGLNLTEILDLFSSMYRCRVDAKELLGKINLSDKAKAMPAQLSGGQRQRFSIACALVNEPRVLFLDEPTTGLDPQAKRNLWQLIRKLNDEGMTIVITTHNMEEAEVLCHRIAIMDKGKIIALGKPESLISQYAPDCAKKPSMGSLEDVFLHLTGTSLRD